MTNFNLLLLLVFILACGEEKTVTNYKMFSTSSEERTLKSDRSGSGGEGWVCRDKKDSTKILSVELADYVEAEVVEGILPDLSVPGKNAPTYVEVLEELIGRINQFDRDYVSSHYMSILNVIKAYEVKKGENPIVKIAPFKKKGENKIFHLNQVGDSNRKFSSKSQNCQFEQIARQNRKVQRYTTPIVIHPDYVPYMTEETFGSLLFHEIGLALANELGHENSDNTRYFTSIIGSNRLRDKEEIDYLLVLASAGFIASGSSKKLEGQILSVLNMEDLRKIFLASRQITSSKLYEEYKKMFNSEKGKKFFQNLLLNRNFFSLDSDDELVYGSGYTLGSQIVTKGRPYNRIVIKTGVQFLEDDESGFELNTYNISKNYPEKSIEWAGENLPRKLFSTGRWDDLDENSNTVFSVKIGRENKKIEHKDVFFSHSQVWTADFSDFYYEDKNGFKILKRKGSFQQFTPKIKTHKIESSQYLSEVDSEGIYEKNTELDNGSPLYINPIKDVSVHLGNQEFTFLKQNPLYMINWSVKVGMVRNRKFLAISAFENREAYEQIRSDDIAGFLEVKFKEPVSLSNIESKSMFFVETEFELEEGECAIISIPYDGSGLPVFLGKEKCDLS